MDEAQQYGKMDEVAILARTSPSCSVMWTGDHRQTREASRTLKTEDAKEFCRKFISRPLGLRSDTEYTQPHHLPSVFTRFLNGPDGSPIDRILSYLCVRHRSMCGTRSSCEQAAVAALCDCLAFIDGA